MIVITQKFLKNLPAGIFFMAANLFCCSTINAQTCNTDLTNNIALTAITASGENAPAETRDKAFDNIFSTKWLTTASTGYLQVDLGTAQIVTNYSITSANDVPARDPKNFNLSGSNNGTSFTILHTVTGEAFATRYLTKYYSFANATAYRYYKLTITANSGDASTQLSEIQLMTTNNCIVGNVYNNAAGTGYNAIPVVIRNRVGSSGNTVASTTTNAAGHFAFTTAQAPQDDYAVIIQPPANTYFASGPGINLNSTMMSSNVYNYMQQELWPTGAFLNVNGDINGVTNSPYLIDNTEGVKTPPSLDWVLKTFSTVLSGCPKITNTLDGGGTFGNLSAADYINEHSWQPGFHAGPVPTAGEPHPNLFKQLSTATSDYINGNLLLTDRGSLYDEGKYNLTSFMGTLQDAALIYSRTSTSTFINSTFNFLNGYNGGWRKTYGRTTGDPYDLFLAANGQTTSTGSILEFTSDITSTGTMYLNFYGKNASSFPQNISSDVAIIFSVYNSSNVLVGTSTLTLSAVTAAAQDDPTSPWEGRSFSFPAASTGTYTFKLSVPTTAQLGNDFYLDNVELTECPIQYTLTGKVWDDANGDVTVSFGENTPPAISSSLYVNLVDTKGFIVSSVTVAADGTYNMPVPVNGSGYKLVLTSDPGLNTPSLPAGGDWVNTGQNVSLQNTAIQSGTAGVIELNTGTSDIANQDFGIERLPDSNPRSQVVPYPAGGIIPAGAVTTAVTGSDPEDGTLGNSNTFVVTVLPANAVMYYNGIVVAAGMQVTGFNPALLSFKGITTGSAAVAFQYAFKDAAGKQDATPATFTVSWPGVLPIVLESFIVTKENEGVRLSWKSSSAQNLDRFVIEYSTDAVNFTPLTSVPATGNSNTPVTYTWLHNSPAAGNNYYRLKMTDIDGEYTYSIIRSIKMNGANEPVIVYPDPVRSTLHLFLPQPATAHTLLNIYSNEGRLLYSKATGITQTVTVPLNSFADGICFIKVTEDGVTLYNSKFIKQ